MSKLYKRIDAVEEEEFGDDLVVMNTRTQVVSTLNGTARVVWDALAKGEELVRILKGRGPALLQDRTPAVKAGGDLCTRQSTSHTLD